MLLGGPDDRTFVDQIVVICRTPILDLVGRTTLRRLCAMLALAEFVVCNDSGPMHIAAALGKPLVAIFGPTNPARTGPYCRTAHVVSAAVPCAPCYRRQCPLGHHNCMQRLEIGVVLGAVLELWGKQRQADGLSLGVADDRHMRAAKSSPARELPTR
jgi:heptosyltransferase-2